MEISMKSLRVYLGKLVNAAIVAVLFYLLIVKPFMYFSEMYFQQEAVMGLTTIVSSNKEFHENHRRWASSFQDIGWSIEPPFRYTFFISETEYRGKPPSELGITPPVDFAAFGAPQAGADDAGFIAVAIGNLDRDPGLDVWWIDQTGEATNIVNDVAFF